MQKKRSAPAGFTLIEMLVVILIIGILAAYFGQNVFSQTNDARLSSAEALITRGAPTALASYYSTHASDNPPSKQELVARGLNKDPIWPDGAWYLTSTSHNYIVSVAYPTGTSSDKPQSFRNAIAIAKLIVAKDYSGEIKDKRIYDISPDYPMIHYVYVKDLAYDGMDGVGGIAVYYDTRIAN